jgi:hypothetical protein
VLVGTGVAVGIGVLVAEGMAVNVGLRVLIGAGVSVGTLARKLGALQPNPTTAKITNARNISLCFFIRYPLPQLSFCL